LINTLNDAIITPSDIEGGEQDGKKNTARPSGTSSAEVIPVIRTTTAVGKGTPSDLCRIVTQYWSLEGELLATADPEATEEANSLDSVASVDQWLSAAFLRHDIMQRRKAQGLSTDLGSLIAEYRSVCPEYADALERLIYPEPKTTSD